VTPFFESPDKSAKWDYSGIASPLEIRYAKVDQERGAEK
jgi:hypothetical protein